MPRFLITGIGGDVAQGICKVIRESFEEAMIVGTDTGEKHAGPLFVEKFKIIPSASDSDYIRSLKLLIKESRIEILIPTSEPEIEVLNSVLELDLGCKIITPGSKVINVCLDKYETNRFLKSINVSVPWTIKSQEQIPKEYPCIFKGTKGAGSKLLYIVADKSEATYLAGRYTETIFQELLLPDDSEVTVAVYRSTEGSISILQLQRSLVGGATSWARVINDDEVNEMCRLVAKELHLIGSMNIQLRITNNGPRIFEINPRFSSTVYMRFLIGFNDVLWSINDRLGLDCSFPNIAIGTELVRTYDSKILVTPNKEVK